MAPNKITRRQALYVIAGAAVAAAVGGGILSMLGRSSGEQSTVSGEITLLARSAYHQTIHQNGLIPYFNKQYPNVRVNYIPKGYNDEYQIFVLAMRNKSSDYDVAYIDEPWTTLALIRGWAEPLGDVDLSGVPDLVANLGKYNGQIYAVPITGNFNFMFYNSKILEEIGENPPRSWDDVLRIAQEVTEKLAPNVYGWSGNYPSVVDDVYLTVLLSLGGHVFDPKDRVTPVFYSQEAIDALNIVKELARWAHPKTLSWTSLTEYSDAILQGEIAMGQVWNGWVARVDDPSVSKVVGQIEIMPDPGKYQVSQTGIWYYIVPVYSLKKDLGKLYVEVATSYGAQKYASINAGLPPTRITVYQDPDVQQQNRLASSYVKIAQAAQPARTSPIWMDAYDYLNRQMLNAILGKISVEEAIKNCQNELVQLSKQAGLI
ncbi:sugar ABC transporter substrate-binding protein [Pyrobaculum aerophilum]|uniref:Sugar ABC transporter substrate-binding protein n=1 Tax=Pyrobaculum aerophilum TaxID=13773 RepID=A0A371QVP6_9CREN|nr:sugar ABC transporter substrate-binding protein [Pyrobaculum aerophilum]RFA97518.1 sugar ABC transporter substrate-binding protein [Pyrobaculum aerophilum]